MVYMRRREESSGEESRKAGSRTGPLGGFFGDGPTTTASPCTPVLVLLANLHYPLVHMAKYPSSSLTVLAPQHAVWEGLGAEWLVSVLPRQTPD